MLKMIISNQTQSEGLAFQHPAIPRKDDFNLQTLFKIDEISLTSSIFSREGGGGG